MKLTEVKKLKDLICELSFDELFNTDIRTFLNKEDPIREELENTFANVPEDENKAEREDKIFKLRNKCGLHKSVKENSFDWDCEIIKFLEEEFECPVYSLRSFVSEHHINKLFKTGIHFHITHFNSNKKYITSKENRNNRTIMFWFFGDKLIIRYCEGIDSW